MNTIAIQTATLHLTKGILSRFVPIQQRKFLEYLLRTSEEREWFATTLNELAVRIAAMPKLYAQEKLGKQAIVHLHYFTGSGNWWLTETSQEDGQTLAFGRADLYGDGGELGMMDVGEMVECPGLEIDLHWRPRTLAEIAAEREPVHA